jgi:L-threonylcarbamoyladenylate synthase
VVSPSDARGAAILEPDDASLERAAARLRGGGLVAFPTETVYGLGADACSDAAVVSIYALKRRPRFNPLIAHVATPQAARALVEVDDRAESLMARFWPGPLTLVLPRRPDCPVSLLAADGLPTLAVRQPAHPVALALLAAFGGPLVAPSANRSGRVSPTMAAHVAAEFSETDLTVLEGGPCRVGLESTVLDLSGPQPALLRPGAVTRAMLEGLLGPLGHPEPTARPLAPGQLASHYAPHLPVRLHATAPHPGEALLAFGAADPAGFAEVFWLSRGGDPAEAAARLFAGLRALDRPTFTGIAVSPIPDAGLGEALNDRLRRAAAERPGDSPDIHPGGVI